MGQAGAGALTREKTGGNLLQRMLCLPPFPYAVALPLVPMAAMYGHWLTHLRRICDIPSRRLLSAVLYGETPLGADRAEEVRLTDKRKLWYCAPDPARPGGPKGMGQFGIVKKCRVTNGMWGFS